MNEICCIEDVTGQAARALRLSLDMTQKDFWGAVGVLRDTGNNYERGGTNMPMPVRRLVFLKYVLHFPVDGKLEEMQEISEFIQTRGMPARQLRQAIKEARKAADSLEKLLGEK